MFRKSIAPRISETNITGHIGHNAVPVWLEEGYTDIFRLFKQDISRPGLIMVNLSMDFLEEIFLGSDVDVLTGVRKIGTSSVVLYQEIRQEGKLCVRGTTTFANFDYGQRKPVPIPQAVRDALGDHLLAS